MSGGRTDFGHRRSRRGPAWLLALASLPAAGCDDAGPMAAPANTPPTASAPSTVVSADGSWRVSWRTDPATIVLDAPFAVELAVTPADSPDVAPGAAPGAAAEVAALELSIDARMPHHRHGMLVRPTVRRLGPGRFRAEGLLLHMPGYWEFHFDLVSRGTVERAQVSFEIDG